MLDHDRTLYSSKICKVVSRTSVVIEAITKIFASMYRQCKCGGFVAPIGVLIDIGVLEIRNTMTGFNRQVLMNSSDNRAGLY